MHKIIIIAGPTATGKSDLAVALARKIGGEIISADSRQIYKGMDIGTGKISRREMRGVPHHLLDIVSPKSKYTRFSVAKFQTLALKKIRAVAKRGRVPIVVGGTGFWIDALVSGQELPDVPANPRLRVQLNKKTSEQLLVQLAKLDSARAAAVDPHNKRRLVRAIEIALGMRGKKAKKAVQRVQIAPVYLYLDLPTETLDKKIELRLAKRLRQGLLKEVRALHRGGVSYARLEELGLEYKFAALHLQNKITLSEMKTQLLFAIKHYARRQRTWFRRNRESMIALDASKSRAAQLRDALKHLA